ncbi:MAG: peptidyl-tRNA hydrolase [Candidatus Xenolissoclinum pacificiensis L6]|uniref:Peptidyl-tRNA hydrolase n=1 Tax=Candidatus Xenolissoclinum pacificiensis L6 TaxID=1401685 RepID=W2V2L8_9RICK|nr:MAG: peptidyl-tRNA hydrolase [Candidatus Xenolissoclinum pacificiensis L6]
MIPPYVIAGLGNVGDQYENTRHNIGFLILNKLHSEMAFPSFSEKFSGMISKMSIFGRSVILFKPCLFMNRSGIPLAQLRSFYKYEMSNLLVIHDDIDLELGVIKCKQGGSSGGHNGIKSVDEHLGNRYYRMRFGVGRPSLQSSVANYVLSCFEVDITVYINRAVEGIQNIISVEKELEFPVGLL